MNFKDDKGFILIFIGTILTITIYGSLIGIPLIFIGLYFVYKRNKDIGPLNDAINKKKEELTNIEDTLSILRKEKEEEINIELKDKYDELDNIQEKLDELEANRFKEVDEKLKNILIKIKNLDVEYKELKEKKENKLNEQISDKKECYDKVSKELKEIEKELVLSKDELFIQDHGLYEPKYRFVDSVAYKERLDAVRKEQKQMVRDKTAAIATGEFTLNEDKRQGKAFINDNIKQILRTFNLEAENTISKVKHSNIEQSEKRIRKSFDQLNKLNQRVNVMITQHYLDLKLDELYIAYEYDVKKEEEKELLREAREREKEENKIKKELEKEKNKFNKQNEKINSEIEEIKQKMADSAAEEKAKLEAEIIKLQEALNKNNEEIGKINEWKKSGAGYVYIISNIGSFGENIYKIGVTRRNNPEDRIRELSSASVPFKYDTHVFIFSKDAFSLESELHNRFDKQRVNKVNRRKEFFKITIDEVKQIVEENKGSIHSFVEKPDAEEYYDTLKIEKQMRI